MNIPEFDARLDEIEARFEGRAASRAFAASIHSPTSAKTRRGNTVEVSSAARLAVEELQSQGMTREEALERIVDAPQTVGELAEQINARREAIVADANLAEDAAFAASPEGRLEQGRQELRRQQETAEQANAARAFLIARDPALDSDLSAFSDVEVIAMAGITTQEGDSQ